MKKTLKKKSPQKPPQKTTTKTITKQQQQTIEKKGDTINVR